MLYLKTNALKRPHGFSLRNGGVSTGTFASLNLATKWGDSPEHVAENTRRLAAEAGFDVQRLFVAKQVHGREVCAVDASSTQALVAATDADALVTGDRNTVLGIRTADCVPVLLASDHEIVGAAHAGWRGVAAGVVTATLDEMAARGAPPESLSAAIGPHICLECFEVGEDVAKQFDQIAPSCVVRGDGQKPRIDLGAAVHLQLLESGVSPARIERVNACTKHEASRFFSFRREGEKTGAHLSFIQL